MSHSSRTGAAWTAGWVLAGVAWAAGLLGVLTIGVFILPAAALATVLLALRPAGRARWAAVLVGAGLPLAYVAYLNRSGPGTVCTQSATSQSCVDQSNPWVWLVAALLVIGAGAVLSARHRGSN